MGVVGSGSLLMVIALTIYAYALLRMLLTTGRQVGVPVGDLTVVSWGGSMVDRQRAWAGPLSVCVLVIGMYVFTALSFEILQDLPIISAGGGHGGH